MAYCGYITRLKNVRKHPNADRLQLGECFGNTVVVGLEYIENQLGVYFPVDGQLSPEFCAAHDLVRRKDENGNPAGGYLDPDKRNIKAVKLRGEKSDGLFMPITCLANFTTISDLKDGDTVTEYNGVEICRKYIPKRKSGTYYGGGKKGKAQASFAPTFFEHVDTDQLAYHLSDFKHGDVVELTLKMHGTSGRTGYLPLVTGHEDSFNCYLANVFRKLSARLRGKPDPEPRHDGPEITKYGYVTGTRRVVLDIQHDGGFYADNAFRREMAKKFEGKLRKGEVVYYEIVGFVNKDTPIMASVKNSKIKDKEFTKQYGEETVFSYGCDPNGDWFVTNTELGCVKTIPPKCEVYVYRMTQVNEDGDVFELSPTQMRQRCEQMGVKCVPLFDRFVIPYDLTWRFPNGSGEETYASAGEYVLRQVERWYDGPDPIGKTHIREGVVARIVNRPDIAVYKHKNFNFKVLEGIIKEDATAPDMEEAQEVENNE